MKWQRGYRSGNVIDRRGQRAGMGNVIGLVPLVSRFGWKGIVVLVIVAAIAWGAQSLTKRETSKADDEMAGFVGFVLDDAQDMWAREFDKRGWRYEPARLVLPLKQGAGVPNRPLVRAGERVRAGQPLGEVPAGELGAPIHAPIDGVVESVGAEVVLARTR